MLIQNLIYSQLSDLLEDFYKVTKIRISFWNSEGVKCLMAPADGNSDFCNALRKIPDIEALCQKCDRDALKNVLKKEASLYQFRCSAGLVEYVIPAYYSGNLLGYFMFGQVRNPNKQEDGSIERLALYREYHFDAEYMDALYMRLPTVEESAMISAGRMLVALTRYAYQNGHIWDQTLPLIQKVERYIQTNFMYPIGIDTACTALHVSRSTLSHTIQREMCSTFTSLLKRQRAQNVRKCLQNGQTIAEAAYNSGFQSVNYMTRVFKELIDMSPSQYQQALRQDEPLLRENALYAEQTEGPVKMPALLIDRDGTMGDGSYQMRTPQEYAPFPNTREAFKLLRHAGFPIYIITNQSCIARGLDGGYDFAAEFYDIGADDWFICPHDSQDICDCRKPLTGLIDQAQAKYALDLHNAYTIGDRWSDMVAGGRAGTKLILVLTGRGEEAMSVDRAMWSAYTPDYVAQDLLDAAIWLIKRHNGVVA